MNDGSKNAIVCWLLNFRIRMFVKSAVNLLLKTRFLEKKKVLHGHLGNTVTSLLRPLFLAAGQSVYFELNTLSCKKTLINTAKFFWPIGDRINGVPPYFNQLLDFFNILSSWVQSNLI